VTGSSGAGPSINVPVIAIYFWIDHRLARWPAFGILLLCAFVIV
jgi:hypothetical protein